MTRSTASGAGDTDELAAHRLYDDNLYRRAANIPDELSEAAAIDGATPWQTLTRITIPMVMPSVTICSFLTLTNSCAEPKWPTASAKLVGQTRFGRHRPIRHACRAGRRARAAGGRAHPQHHGSAFGQRAVAGRGKRRDEQRAQVFFDVLMRESPDQQAPSSVREVWHFVRPIAGGSWKLDGIQQVD